MGHVNIHAAKTHLSKLIDQAIAGEEVVIARAGKPVVKLVPIEAPTPRRVFGQLAGKLNVRDNFDDPLPDDLLALFEGEGE